MQVEISTDNNIECGEKMMRQIETQLTDGFSRFGDELTRAEVHLGDESAGRSIGADQRCMLEARPAGRAPTAVTQYTDSIDGAIRGATEKLVALLDKGRS